MAGRGFKTSTYKFIFQYIIKKNTARKQCGPYTANVGCHMLLIRVSRGFLNFPKQNHNFDHLIFKTAAFKPLPAGRQRRQHSGQAGMAGAARGQASSTGSPAGGQA